MTRDLATALQPLGITLHDHIVVAAGGHVSLRASGLI
jgi:DNA repair protein RadC